MRDGKPLFLGVFPREENILAATRATREAGYDIHDVFSPYAVEGLAETMGLRSSRLTWVCLLFALFGLSVAVGLQFWTSSIDWPLNIGGKPFNSLPAYLPIMFELMVLFGGVGVVMTFFVRARLFPSKSEWLPHIRVTNDCFVLALRVGDLAFDPEAVERLWQRYDLVEVRFLPESTR